MARLAERTSRIATSATMAVGATVDKLRRSGVEVIDFGAGEPDFGTPEAIKSAAHKALDAEFTKYTPVPGIAGLTLDQIDVIESNEAFAAQAAAVAKVLGFDPEKVNPNGSGVSLGHPVGATGCIMTVKAIYELKRIGGRYGLITMCIGGGQGIAMVIENVN